MPPAATRDQSGFLGFFARLRPGPELIEVIAEGFRSPNRRLGWRLPSIDGAELCVPRSAWLRGPRDGRPGEILPELPDPREVLRGRVGPHFELILGLERGKLPPLRELRPHEGADARRLLAAAMADIAAMRVETRNRSSIDDILSVHATQCRRYVHEGRQLWAQLGAWPWFHWPDARRPKGWSNGIGSEAAFMLSVWAVDGQLTLLERGRAND